MRGEEVLDRQYGQNAYDCYRRFHPDHLRLSVLAGLFGSTDWSVIRAPVNITWRHSMPPSRSPWLALHDGRDAGAGGVRSTTPLDVSEGWR